MSAIFYRYRDGKKDTAFKYEEVDRIWYTKAKDGSPQISIYIGDKVYSSWDLGEHDIEFTQRSHEKAAKIYNEALIKIGTKDVNRLKRKTRINDPIKKKKKKRRKYTI